MVARSGEGERCRVVVGRLLPFFLKNGTVTGAEDAMVVVVCYRVVGLVDLTDQTGFEPNRLRHGG